MCFLHFLLDILTACLSEMFLTEGPLVSGPSLCAEWADLGGMASEGGTRECLPRGPA